MVTKFYETYIVQWLDEGSCVKAQVAVTYRRQNRRGKKFDAAENQMEIYNKAKIYKDAEQILKSRKITPPKGCRAEIPR